MKHTRYILPLLFFGLSILSGWAQQGQERGKRMKFDILIQGAHVFDGISKDSSLLDVGIKGERIVFVGKATRRHKGKKEIDGRGLYLAPGFIDPHTHYSRQLGHRTRDERAVLRALKQGVTTVFEGNDGSG